MDLVDDRCLAQSTRLRREALRTQFDLWLRCRHAVGLLALLESDLKQTSRASACTTVATHAGISRKLSTPWLIATGL